MNSSLLHTLYLAGAFLVLFASSEFFYHVFKFKAEITRKYVHFSTGIITMLFPVFIGNHWLVMTLCGSFLIILASSMRYNILPSINAVERVTHGSLLYPIVVYGCYLAFDYSGHFSFFYIPILILAVSDPIAALVGKNYPKGVYTFFNHQKTSSGSLGFFTSAFVLCFFLFMYIDHRTFYYSLFTSIIVALVTTVLEAISHKGYDNFTIPAGSLLVLFLLENYV